MANNVCLWIRGLLQCSMGVAAGTAAVAVALMAGAAAAPAVPVNVSLQLANQHKTCLRSLAISTESTTAEERIIPPFPAKRVVLGCGTVVVDYLASVASFPQPDEKIRSVDFQFQGGGNVGNSLTGAARLGLKPKLISKVADDPLGERILAELEADGVDTSNVVVAKGGISPFTYVIIDKEKLTRTCIHTPGHPPMLPSELAPTTIANVLAGTDLVFFDTRLTDTAIEIAKEASELDLPILIDAEKKREYLDELLIYADYVVASSKFPEAWTGAGTLAEALLSVVSRLRKLKFIIVTLGEDGCVMLETTTERQQNEILDVNATLDSLREQLASNKTPHSVVVSSQVGRLVPSAGDGDKEIFGRLIVGTAEKVPASQLVDTTGAGDAFIGAVMYSLCAGFTPEKMLPFASTVAAANCQAVGARAGLPRRHDARIIDMLSERN